MSGKQSKGQRTSAYLRRMPYQLAEGQLSGEESCYDKKPSLNETLHIVLHLKALSAANKSNFGFEMASSAA